MIPFHGRMTERPEESYHFALYRTGFDGSDVHSLKQAHQCVRLCGELPRIGLPQPFQILQLQSQTGELLQMRHAEQRSFRLCCDQ